MSKVYKKEADIKKEVKKVIAKHNAYDVMYVPVGFGKAGVPDFVVCVYGVFVGIETKLNARKNPPTKLQTLNLHQIEQAGGLAIVVDETNVAGLYDMFSKLSNTSVVNDEVLKEFREYSASEVVDPMESMND